MGEKRRGEGDKQAIHKGITAALYGISCSQRGITVNTGRRLNVNCCTGLELSCYLKVDVFCHPVAGLLRWTQPRDLLGRYRKGKFCFSHFAEVHRACLELNHELLFLLFLTH